jgi:hypothetical protein
MAKNGIVHDEELDDVPGEVIWITAEEGEHILDRQTRKILGISGDEFLRRWDAGEYADDPDAPGVRQVVPFLSFVR